MLYWDKHQPKKLVFHTEHAALPVFSCIKIRYFIEEYFGVYYIYALVQQLGFFMFGNVKITWNETHYTFEDLEFIDDVVFKEGGDITWNSL